MSEKILKATTVLMVGEAVKDKSGSSRRWRPSLLSWGIAVLALGGMATALYPMTAAWLSSYNQSKVIESAALGLDALSPGKLEQLELARVYNDALAAGVKLEAGGNVPVGAGNLAGTDLKYVELLRASSDGLMARIRIPSIDVDLPVYHGTSDETLLRGAGHLEGSHLPVGGMGTRSVITAHRGLANSTMFTHLDQLRAGERFSVEVMGEVFAYQISEVEVIEPTETSSLRARSDKDLVTLITCTPLGVNSHRIVVTGERITPTPDRDIAAAGKPPMIPGFPWWGVVAGGGTLLVATYIVRRGILDARSYGRGQ